MLTAMITSLLNARARPTVGLPALFLIALVSATLLPMGSEPAVFAVVKLNGDMFWPAVLVATAGKTVGGAISWAMGYGAKRAFAKERQTRWFGWLQRFGPRTLLMSWLPVVGDPLCSLAGWLKMPVWPCVVYMAIGTFGRYFAMTWLLLEVPDGLWHRMLDWI